MLENFKGMGTQVCWNIQRNLSVGQAVPIVGPTLISPCKAVFSTAQLISGLAVGIFLGIPGVLGVGFNNFYLLDKSFLCFVHCGMGVLGIGYSISNMLTLGFFGFVLENNK